MPVTFTATSVDELADWLSTLGDNEDLTKAKLAKNVKSEAFHKGRCSAFYELALLLREKQLVLDFKPKLAKHTTKQYKAFKYAGVVFDRAGLLNHFGNMLVCEFSPRMFCELHKWAKSVRRKGSSWQSGSMKSGIKFVGFVSR